MNHFFPNIPNVPNNQEGGGGGEGRGKGSLTRTQGKKGASTEVFDLFQN